MRVKDLKLQKKRLFFTRAKELLKENVVMPVEVVPTDPNKPTQHGIMSMNDDNHCYFAFNEESLFGSSIVVFYGTGVYDINDAHSEFQRFVVECIIIKNAFQQDFPTTTNEFGKKCIQYKFKFSEPTRDNIIPFEPLKVEIVTDSGEDK